MFPLVRSTNFFLRRGVGLIPRRYLCAGILALGGLVLFHLFVLEPYQVPTGSMAPALCGHHRVCVCPCCGHDVVVGRSSGDTQGDGDPRFYQKAFCPNCGHYPVSVAETLEIEGNRVMVSKSSYLWRLPRRLEIVVFRLLQTVFIKRLLGLPGEEILIHDGDVYVNGELVRKTMEEVKAMRVLVFSQECAPRPAGWRCRWERSGSSDPPFAANPRDAAAGLLVDGLASPQTLTYRNFLLQTGKCELLRDEYAYNAGVQPDSECVHDFMVETDIEIAKGRGSVALCLCDGHDWVEVLFPVGDAHAAEVFCWPTDHATAMQTLGETPTGVALEPGRRYRVEAAFVDRRLLLAVDGRHWLSVDLPAAKNRAGVERPFQVQADGVQIALHSFQLYRDVHYGQQGRNGVRGKAVRLGADQYFVLGDNSANSQDSRFWPEQGRVAAGCLIGPAWLAYGTSPLRRLP
jgi:signal peptidase I